MVKVQNWKAAKKKKKSCLICSTSDTKQRQRVTDSLSAIDLTFLTN